MVVRSVTALALLAVSAPAFAAVDIVPSISAPAGVSVYGSGHWTVTVSNTGSTTANGVSLTIALPRTNTSPSVYVMGTVTGKSSTCTTSGTNLVCTIGTIRGRRSATPVYFDITFPESVNPLTVTASVTTTSSESVSNQANNSTSTNATLANYASPSARRSTPSTATAPAPASPRTSSVSCSPARSANTRRS